MEKMEHLKRMIAGKKRLAIAFSGGRDSTLVALASYKALGNEAVAITVRSDLMSSRDVKDAFEVSELIGIGLEVIYLDQLSLEGFAVNTPDRCAICKKALMTKVIEKAKEMGIGYVADGAVVDDKDDYRPGHRVATDIGVIHPLIDSGIDHKDVENILKEEGVPIWNKSPSPCLATRIPTNQIITKEKTMIADMVENRILDLGFKTARMRILEGQDGSLYGVIEVDNPKMALDMWDDITADMDRLRIFLDPRGYRMGSMNKI